MFGLKRMHRQRVRLYERTQVLEKRAKASREKAVDELFDKATSPAGLMPVLYWAPVHNWMSQKKFGKIC